MLSLISCGCHVNVSDSWVDTWLDCGWRCNLTICLTIKVGYRCWRYWKWTSMGPCPRIQAALVGWSTWIRMSHLDGSGEWNRMKTWSWSQNGDINQLNHSNWLDLDQRWLDLGNDPQKHSKGIPKRVKTGSNCRFTTSKNVVSDTINSTWTLADGGFLELLPPSWRI